MKKLLIIILFSTISYGQTIAVVNDDFHVLLYEIQDGEWVALDFDIGLQVTHLSFGDNAELWCVGMSNQFFSTDCDTWVNWHSPIPGGKPTDISARDRIVISADGGVCEFNINTGSWVQLSSTFGGRTRIEYAYDEDEEIYKTGGSEAWGGRNLLQVLNLGSGGVYDYPQISGMYIFDVTYHGYPLVIAGPSRHTRYVMYYDGENWVDWGMGYDNCYKAVDATYYNVAVAQCDGWTSLITFNQDYVDRIDGDIIDIAMCDYSISE